MRSRAALSALVALGGWASADPLSRARSEIEALRLDAARASLWEALGTGRNGPAEVAEVYRLAGEVAAAIGRPEDARRHFRRLLALEPRTRLREGTSPKIVEPFAEARRDLGGHRLRIGHAVADGISWRVVLVVKADPAGMVAGARASCRMPEGETRTLEARGRGRIEIAVPAAPRVDVVLAAIDTHGNRLVEVGPIRVERPAAARAGTPWPRRWYLWAGLAAGAGAAGMVFGLRSRAASEDLAELNAESESHQFSEAEALEDRARQSALAANMSVGLAGALGATAAVMAFLEYRGSARGEAATPHALGGHALAIEF